MTLGDTAAKPSQKSKQKGWCQGMALKLPPPIFMALKLPPPASPTSYIACASVYPLQLEHFSLPTHEASLDIQDYSRTHLKPLKQAQGEACKWWDSICCFFVVVLCFDMASISGTSSFSNADSSSTTNRLNRAAASTVGVVQSSVHHHGASTPGYPPPRLTDLWD